MIENGKPAGGDAVLISVPGNRELPELVEEHLDELAFLAETAGLATIKRFVQNLPHPDSRTFIGKGKLDEIKAFVGNGNIANVISTMTCRRVSFATLKKNSTPGRKSASGFMTEACSSWIFFSCAPSPRRHARRWSWR